MGIEYEDMKTILACSKEIKSKEKLLILGDAVIHFTPQQYAELARKAGITLSTIPAILDPFTLGKSLGFSSTETLDINGKTTLNVDLTKPLLPELIGQYDCIIDGGVLFWCFEPGTALKNIYLMAKEGGVIVHITAISGYYGRGYYSIQPRLFEDFYLANKAKFLVSTYRTKFRNRNCKLKNFFGRFVGFRDKNYVTVSNKPGNIFLSLDKDGKYIFSSFPSSLEPNMIPNNLTGVQIFQKNEEVNQNVVVPCNA
jgi:hypothetical protein